VAGQKYKHGYQYEVYDGDDSGLPNPPVPPKDPGLSVGGSRDADAHQIGPRQPPEDPSSRRKRAATSEPPGSDSRSKGPAAVASRADFPEDHWAEPQSDVIPPTPIAHVSSPTPIAHVSSPTHRADGPGLVSSPMKTDSPVNKGKAKAIQDGSSPISSSPISQNALLRARHADNSWLKKQGLHGPGDDFHPPNFVHSRVSKEGVAATRALQKSKLDSMFRKSVDHFGTAYNDTRAKEIRDFTSAGNKRRHSASIHTAGKQFTTHTGHIASEDRIRGTSEQCKSPIQQIRACD
jgi:hypothetical protein